MRKEKERREKDTGTEYRTPKSTNSGKPKMFNYIRKRIPVLCAKKFMIGSGVCQPGYPGNRKGFMENFQASVYFNMLNKHLSHVFLV